MDVTCESCRAQYKVDDALRAGDPPVMGRIVRPRTDVQGTRERDERLFLDCRTVLPAQVPALAAALTAAAARL